MDYADFELTTYKEWSPTQFDCRGAFLPDRQDWYVVPVIRTRDSGPLDESNFVSALEILEDESDTIEVHRFDHWGPGWFEIIIAHPSRHADVAKIVASLSDYPVLNDDDFAERKYELALRAWNDYGYRDLLEQIGQTFELNEPTQNFLESLDSDKLWELHSDRSSFGYECNDTSVNFDFRWVDEQDFQREDLAAFICKNHRN